MTTPEKALKPPVIGENIEILPANSVPSLRLELNRNVERLAYDFFERAGEAHGGDLQHWLDAQTAVMGKNVEVRESGPWFHFHCLLGRSDPGHVRVAIDRAEVLVHIQSKGDASASGPGPSPIFFWAKWPQEVDPSTAAAYIKDEKLTVEVKKTDPPAPNETVEAPCAPVPEKHV